MIYIKNTTEIQTIFIPRNELQKEAFVSSTKTYEDGYREGLEDGKEYQKDQLLNLYVTENGQYEREDGWGIVTVDVPIGDCSASYEEGYEIGKNEGYEDGFQDGYDQGQSDCPECDDCPELTSINITKNGSYEGAFKLVNVDVPNEGGSCNLTETSINLRKESATLIASNDGYDGYSKVTITAWAFGDVRYAEGYEQGYNDASNTGSDVSYKSIAMEIENNATPIIMNDYSLRNNDLDAVWEMSTTEGRAIFNTLENNGVNQLAQNFLRNYTEMTGVKTYTLKSIGENAFKDWNNLTYIEMSKTLGRVGANAFLNCTNLKKLICKAITAPILGSDSFKGISETGTLYIPKDADYNSWTHLLGSGWNVEYL